MKVRLWKTAACLSLLLFLGGCASMQRAARPVHSLERIQLGGVEQTILIQGDSAANPVLLFLHGGPGFPNMPFTHANAELRRDFIVVDWDQRGAGRSVLAGEPPESMRIEQFVRDTEELASMLRRRFGGKIYLVGHSWGSLVGALAASRSPELFHAYIGIAQLVNVPRSNTALHQRALVNARAQGNAEAERAIRGIGPPPHSDGRDKKVASRVGRELAPRLPRRMTPGRFFALALTSPNYSILEAPRILRGARNTWEAVTDELHAVDLAASAPVIRVPVWFFISRHDTVLSPDTSLDYHRKLRVPAGKKLLWFERSDHFPHLEEPEAYAAAMRSIKAEVESRAGR